VITRARILRLELKHNSITLRQDVLYTPDHNSFQYAFLELHKAVLEFLIELNKAMLPGGPK